MLLKISHSSVLYMIPHCLLFCQNRCYHSKYQQKYASFSCFSLVSNLLPATTPSYCIRYQKLNLCIYAVERKKTFTWTALVGAICSKPKIRNKITEKNPENCTLSTELKYDQLVSNSVWLIFSGILSLPFVSFISRLIACIVACSFNETLFCLKLHPSFLVQSFNYLAVCSCPFFIILHPFLANITMQCIPYIMWITKWKAMDFLDFGKTKPNCTLLNGWKMSTFFFHVELEMLLKDWYDFWRATFLWTYLCENFVFFRRARVYKMYIFVVSNCVAFIIRKLSIYF